MRLVEKEKILITGVAGFIGAAVATKLLEDASYREKYEVIGLDNLNDYYDPNLKLNRLSLLGFKFDDVQNIPYNELQSSALYEDMQFIKLNLQDVTNMEALFQHKKFDIVLNLAAQAGVRYSITNPRTYIVSNIDGFINILEGCRNTHVKHLVYASSSSVYGLNGKVPFSEHDSADHPVSLYAATKKANELMAHSYSSLYKIPTTGLRFFTVYGPWGRPDMSPFLFIDAIMNDRPIKVFNNGDMVRDFTYIDDIVEGIVRILNIIPKENDNWDNINPDPSSSSAPYRIYNIGNSDPVNLMDYISCIEKVSGKSARKLMMPMQPGDVYQTYANSSALAEVTSFKPETSLEKGIEATMKWYVEYFNKN